MSGIWFAIWLIVAIIAAVLLLRIDWLVLNYIGALVAWLPIAILLDDRSPLYSEYFWVPLVVGVVLAIVSVLPFITFITLVKLIGWWLAGFVLFYTLILYPGWHKVSLPSGAEQVSCKQYYQEFKDALATQTTIGEKEAKAALDSGEHGLREGEYRVQAAKVDQYRPTLRGQCASVLPAAPVASFTATDLHVKGHHMVRFDATASTASPMTTMVLSFLTGDPDYPDPVVQNLRLRSGSVVKDIRSFDYEYPAALTTTVTLKVADEVGRETPATKVVTVG